MRVLTNVALALLFAACNGDVGSIPGVFTTGEVRVLGLEPDIRACVVREGISLAVLGEHFGPPEAWASGEHRVVFPPNPPGVPSGQVQLVGDTLFVLVPTGAASGTLLIDAGAYGTAEIEIVVEGAAAAGPQRTMVGVVCTSNPPPPS